MAQHTTRNIGGKVVRDNDTYIVQDNTELDNLVLSSTLLYPKHCTTGHKHEGQEEVYIFIYGRGTMEVDDEIFAVYPGDVITIPDGAFHKVYNDETSIELYFICVFDGSRGTK